MSLWLFDWYHQRRPCVCSNRERINGNTGDPVSRRITAIKWSPLTFSPPHHSKEKNRKKKQLHWLWLVDFKKKKKKRRWDAPHLISVDLMKDGVQHSFTTFLLLKTFEMKNSSVTPRNVIPPLRWLLKIRWTAAYYVILSCIRCVCVCGPHN